MVEDKKKEEFCGIELLFKNGILTVLIKDDLSVCHFPLRS